MENLNVLLQLAIAIASLLIVAGMFKQKTIANESGVAELRKEVKELDKKCRDLELNAEKHPSYEYIKAEYITRIEFKLTMEHIDKELKTISDYIKGTK